MTTPTNKYWYIDNWHGETRSFATLAAARAHALKNNMGVISIHSEKGIAATITGERYFA